WKGDPYRIDTLFMYMANMAWNSSMNTAATLQMLTDKDAATGEYKIPHIIYSDAYYSETVAYADLILPDTTYLERWDCISLLDRPIGGVDGPADSIRQPVVKPDRDVRPFQDVLLEIGVRLGLPAFVNAEGGPRFPAGYKDYIALHERTPGVGPLAGFRGEDGTAAGKGAPNPHQLDRYVANGCFWKYELPPEQLFFKHANKAYLETATAMGLIGAPEPIILQLYVEPLQKFRLAAQGHGTVVPPEKDRVRIETHFDPLPFWYPPFEQTRVDTHSFPLHAITQRPMQMYHSWHSQNAWLRQILGQNRLFMNRTTARSLGLADDDWVWVSSHAGRIEAQLKIMDGVNPNTVWTWNAIGKRSGAWNLAPDSPEFQRGFLLNHLITETLPAKEGEAVAGPNADPITGQAAWYDLRVRVEKARPAEAGHTEPRFATLARLPSMRKAPATVSYGARFAEDRAKENAQ
ncbi:MAG TPA: molybdopterin oxidoreductase family protein, partial [Stellaceae bacterium]|nr:molybdopterin oxidoreductase family protein [Stellaceae bacterium]